ncbi:MAG: helix-turn-helix domain-containing protein [Candidatus Thermoplasmatota archaeon]|nr:helix-turn-helix domain-containing protein [Candidatus Thermoplasmatota archaeon]
MTVHTLFTFHSGVLFCIISVLLISWANPLMAADEADIRDNLPDMSISTSLYDSPFTTSRNANATPLFVKEGIEISATEDTVVTHISNTTIDIADADGITKTIDITKTVDYLSNATLHKSIKGLDNYKVSVNFNSYALDSFTSLVNYTVDWGNGQVEEGNATLLTTLSYVYTQEGEYPITITLTDSNGITYSCVKTQSISLSAGQYVQLWVGDNKEVVAVTSAAGFGSVALLGFAATETGKYKLLALLPLLIPLYTRIQKEDVLDQFVRGEIYGFIKTHPGVHYNQIMRELDVKNGTLSYHLHMLEKTGMVKSRKEGLRFRAFYPTGMKFPQEERYRLTELQTKILHSVKQNEGINQKEIARMLDEKHQTINYNIRVLQQAGLIRLRKKGRSTNCFLFEDAYRHVT